MSQVRMRGMLIVSVLVIGMVYQVAAVLRTHGTQYNEIVQKLFEMVAKEQAQKDIPLVPLEHFYRKKGVYGSYIKQNWHGSLQLAEARRALGIPDNNMFTTAWVTSSLVEAFLNSGGPKPSDDQLLFALESFRDHHDLNKNYNNSLMTFWNMVYNKNDSFYQSSPYNMLELFNLTDQLPMSVIEDLLTKIGLGKFANIIKEIIGGKNAYLHAFQIPPDFDDTFVNLGLGSVLCAAKSDFPAACETWQKQNTNITTVFDALRKYAYRPFSNDSNVNSIDPRTYLWLRKFLDLAKQQGKNVTIVPTWIQNLEEQRTEYYKGVAMPFQINNVDATVAANTVYGMTSAILNGLVNPDVLDDPVIESLYHNTSALLAFEIKNNITDRPDCALLYYPSEVEFDWFVARSFAILDSKRRQGPLPKIVMETVYLILKEAVEGAMTESIILKAKYKGSDQIYYDDFLGNGDLTPDNKTLKRAEDRIFTTAMAANALLYTWTSLNNTTKRIQWRDNTPDSVRHTVQGCINWLSEHVLGLEFKPWNAFFSGSFKGPTTNPFEYPGNSMETINGTIVPWSQRPDFYTTSYSVRGYMEPAEYEAQLKKNHYNQKAPLDFNGYNAWDGSFPFWSSPGYTYAISLLVFSRYNNMTAEAFVNGQ